MVFIPGTFLRRDGRYGFLSTFSYFSVEKIVQNGGYAHPGRGVSGASSCPTVNFSPHLLISLWKKPFQTAVMHTPEGAFPARFLPVCGFFSTSSASSVEKTAPKQRLCTSSPGIFLPRSKFFSTGSHLSVDKKRHSRKRLCRNSLYVVIQELCPSPADCPGPVHRENTDRGRSHGPGRQECHSGCKYQRPRHLKRHTGHQ